MVQYLQLIDKSYFVTLSTSGDPFLNTDKSPIRFVAEFRLLFDRSTSFVRVLFESASYILRDLHFQLQHLLARHRYHDQKYY